MLIQIVSPTEQTVIFSLILIAAILIFTKKKTDLGFFPISVTNELKGLAILAIIFSHIGYFLSADTRFLYPFSTMAGVGVDLFLFMSGYGLAISASNKNLSPWQFYKKRLIKLFVPLWLVIISLLTLDYLLLKKIYPSAEIIGSVFGYFPQADIYNNLNSPFWYLTLILFFYLIFPWLFDRRWPAISAILMMIAAYLTLQIDLPVTPAVLNLYQLHYLAFPFGVLLASGFIKISFFQKFFPTRLEKLLYRLAHFKNWARLIILILLIATVAHFAVNSGVGQRPIVAQTISLLTAFGLILIFLIKKRALAVFNLFGIYSYEIYLIHWPLMYRYDIFYKFLPAWLATIFYLVSFIVLSWLLQQAQKNINKKLFLGN
jgi:peptidoglycan/LPS O-acetylase OafA/YrhL